MINTGKLFVVGNGPGNISLTAPKAAEAIAQSDFVCGYEPYVKQIDKLINDSSEVFTNGMKGEIERVKRAILEASKGRTVALVCGGDASLYSMASLVYELSDNTDNIDVIPGITSALSASAKLGAPVSADLILISMSDLLTPWEIIKKNVSKQLILVILYVPSIIQEAKSVLSNSHMLLSNLWMQEATLLVGG